MATNDKEQEKKPDYRSVMDKLRSVDSALADEFLYPWQIAERNKPLNTVDIAGPEDEMDGQALMEEGAAVEAAAIESEDRVNTRVAEEAEPVNLVYPVTMNRAPETIEDALNYLVALKEKNDAAMAKGQTNIEMAIRHFELIAQGRVAAPRDFPMTAQEAVKQLKKLQRQNVAEVGFAADAAGAVDYDAFYVGMEDQRKNLKAATDFVRQIGQDRGWAEIYADDARLYEIAESYEGPGAGRFARGIVERQIQEYETPLSVDQEAIRVTTNAMAQGLIRAIAAAGAANKISAPQIDRLSSSIARQALNHPEQFTEATVPFTPRFFEFPEDTTYPTSIEMLREDKERLIVDGFFKGALTLHFQAAAARLREIAARRENTGVHDTDFSKDMAKEIAVLEGIASNYSTRSVAADFLTGKFIESLRAMPPVQAAPVEAVKAEAPVEVTAEVAETKDVGSLAALQAELYGEDKAREEASRNRVAAFLANARHMAGKALTSTARGVWHFIASSESGVPKQPLAADPVREKRVAPPPSPAP